MAKFVMLLAPVEVMREAFFLMDSAKAEALVVPNLSKYTRVPVIDSPYDGEDAAHEAFDLTNNPSRQEEREEKYGNGRSLSVGDVVEVEGDGRYLCMSFGWHKL